MKERTEIRDGQEFVVTTLPRDPRLAPSAGKKRALFSALSGVEKRRLIEGRIARAKARKRKRRRRRKPVG